MQVTLTRGEIRTAVEALLGMASGSINAEMQPKLNAQIDEAYRLTLAECRWVSLNRVSYPTLAVDQVSLPYPASAAAGSVYSLAYWDDDAHVFCPLERRPIAPDQDFDPLNAIGGADDEAVRDYPQQWSDEGDEIKIYPPADVEYTMRMAYSLNQALPSDATVCPVDGEAVKLYTMMLAMMDLGDNAGAQAKYVAWERRIDQLQRLQRAGESAVLGELITDDPSWSGVPVPHYDRGPF